MTSLSQDTQPVELETLYEKLENALLISEDPQILSLSKELLWQGVLKAFEMGMYYTQDQVFKNNLTEFSDELLAKSNESKESAIL